LTSTFSLQALKYSNLFILPHTGRAFGLEINIEQTQNSVVISSDGCTYLQTIE